MPQPYALIDAIGTRHTPAAVPARIVCLVPSITELLFELGLEDQIVGRTSYCIHPEDKVQAVPSVGGTKKVKQRMLRELSPTHVIVNIDENPKGMVEQIAEYVPHIVVTHPLEPRDNLDLYCLMGGIFYRQAQAEALCQRFEQALAALQGQGRNGPRYNVIYLIWRKPWMAVARDTYISRTLALIGWNTLPVETKQRYPTLDMTPAVLAEADLILFSTEPYRFRPEDLVDFARQYGCPPEKLTLIDGEMVSWYGSRAIQGLDYLRRFAAGFR